MIAAGMDVTVFIGPLDIFRSIKLLQLQAAVLAQCDAQDELKDGVIGGRNMPFDPAKLLCNRATS
jgi:hypothetical protein